MAAGERKFLWLIFAVALTVRLAFASYGYLKHGTSNYGDDWVYIHYANEILSQGVFVPDTEALDWQEYEGQQAKERNASLVGPGYPLIIALAFLLFGSSLWPVIILNAAASALLCIIIYHLGKELFGKRIGQFGALWCVVYFPYVANLSRVMKEVWLALLLAAVFLLVLRMWKSSRKGRLVVLCSLIYAFLIHMDERYLIYLPVLALAFPFLSFGNKKPGWLAGAAFTALVLLLMVPWMIRNYQVYDKIVLLTPRTSELIEPHFGLTKANGRVQHFGAADHLLPGYVTNEQVKEIIDGNRDTDNANKRISPAQVKAMKEGHLPHSLSLPECRWQSFVQLWQPFQISGEYVAGGYEYEKSWNWKHNLGTGITYGLLLPFSLLALAFLIRYRWRIGILLLSLPLLHTLFHIFFIPFTRTRYRHPIDGIIIVLGAFGMVLLWHLITKKNISLRSLIERYKP